MTINIVYDKVQKIDLLTIQIPTLNAGATNALQNHEISLSAG